MLDYRFPIVQTIETHTEGMPTRIVVDGAPNFPDGSMAEKLAWAESHHNDIRKFLMHEPRGHAAMFGAFLLPPSRSDADYGVIFMSASGFLPMCGHGTIGLAAALVEARLVEVREPITKVRLDTPAGIVVARVRVKGGKAIDVTISNVPSFVVAIGKSVRLAAFGKIIVDIAYGGNFYAIVDVRQLNRALVLSDIDNLMDVGLAIVEAVRDQVPISHPSDRTPVCLRAAMLTEPATPDRPARNLVVKEPGYFDRSPCGTGTSARMAVAHHRGDLAIGEPFIHESILDTRFEGRLTGETDVCGITGVIPEITGRAWITGNSQFTLDPRDSFPTGFAP